MSITVTPSTSVAPRRIPPLENGDHLTREEFERRYEAMPSHVKAELIEGIVYMSPPVSDVHGVPHFNLITWMGIYVIATPGVVGSDNASLRLDLGNMPQPDAFLRISETHGGQSRVDSDRYVEGAPELVAEVAATSASHDLRKKLDAYCRNGVQEYLVWRVFDEEIDYFELSEGRYVKREADSSGILRSNVFPGLWLDYTAIIRRDLQSVHSILQQGLSTPEHREFVAKLANAAAAPKK